MKNEINLPLEMEEVYISGRPEDCLDYNPEEERLMKEILQGWKWIEANILE